MTHTGQAPIIKPDASAKGSPSGCPVVDGVVAVGVYGRHLDSGPRGGSGGASVSAGGWGRDLRVAQGDVTSPGLRGKAQNSVPTGCEAAGESQVTQGFAA